MKSSLSGGTLLPIAALIGSMASLGIGTSFAKYLFPAIGAQGTTALRVTFASIILLAVWRPWRLPLSREQAKIILFYGASLGTMNLLFYMSLRTIPLGIAIAVEFMGPLAVAMWASRKLRDFIWIGFAVLGLLLLLPIREGASQLDLVGILYALAAAVCWALYIIFGQQAGKMHGGQATSLGMTVAALVALPFGVAHAGLEMFNPKLLMAALGIAIMSSVIPYSLEMISLKRLPPKTFGVLLSMEPALGALAALVILGEKPTGIQWVAIGSIIIASVGCALDAGRKKPLVDS